MDYNIDKKLYEEVLESLNNQFNTEIPGTLEDLNFMVDDRWMRDTAVIENVISRNGLWEIFLVFAYYKNPLLLIRRAISVCFAEKKALIYAEYMRRIAAKDPRGTLEISISQFVPHSN